MTNSKIKKAGKNKYKWTGDLTIRDVTKPVTFDLAYTGTTKDGYGNEKAGFAATGTIKRGDYGLKWNKALEAGGVTVSDEVRINLDIQAQKEKTAATTAEAPAAAAPAAPAKKQ
jgi:polyisoprenoid-binding protein YceI